ncbi:MAG: hypothetical protein VKN60_08680 [Cyanobacteriota bacterium]|nr:hypothetical protein [Cyanobacteriota bacterium]
MFFRVVRSSPVLARLSSESALEPFREDPPAPPWLEISFGLSGLLLILLLWNQWSLWQTRRGLRESQGRVKTLEQELQTALPTLRQRENDPDLLGARHLNLDYLRMRLDEEVFHYTVMNQIKQKLADAINEALRSTLPGKDELQVNQCFEVLHALEVAHRRWQSVVLFRVQIRLAQLPTQSSSATLQQLLEAIEIFLNQDLQHPRWLTAIQNLKVALAWDDHSKPIPLLSLEQVSVKSSPAPENPPREAPTVAYGEAEETPR